MKTTETKINEDAARLSDDLRRVRDDLAGLFGSARSRVRDLAADRRATARAKKAAKDLAGSSPEAVVYVEEPGQRAKKVVVKQHRAWGRSLVVSLVLGTAAVLLMRRRKAVVTHLPEGVRGWRFRFHRAATRTVEQEPAVEVERLPGDEAAVREELRTEELPLR